MVNPGAFLGSRGDFIKAQTSLYANAVKDNHIADTVADIQRRYLKRFPASLPDNEEPSEEWLAQVNDEAPDEELHPPDTSSLEGDAANKALADYADLVSRIKFKKEQIKRRLQYIYSKSRDGDSDFDKAMKDPTSAIASKLLGIEFKLPRRRTAYNVWGPKHRVEVDPVFDMRAKETNARKEQHAALRSAVYKDLFEQLSSAEQQKWAQIAEREHEKAVSDAKRRFKNSIPTTPEARQRVIAALPKFIEPILDAVCDYTGWKASFIAGGPEPADGGRLNMISIHSGLTLGSVKMDFGRSQKHAYKHHIAPAFGSFLKKCYSVQDCRESALPDDHTSISINDVAEDEEVAMQVHTFESDAEHENAHRPKRLFEDIAKSGKSTKHSRPPTGTPSPTPRFGPPIGKQKSRILPSKDASLVKLGPSPLSQSFVPAAADSDATSSLVSTSNTTSMETADGKEKEGVKEKERGTAKATSTDKVDEAVSHPAINASATPSAVTDSPQVLDAVGSSSTLPAGSSAAKKLADNTSAAALTSTTAGTTNKPIRTAAAAISSATAPDAAATPPPILPTSAASAAEKLSVEAAPTTSPSAFGAENQPSSDAASTASPAGATKAANEPIGNTPAPSASSTTALSVVEEPPTTLPALSAANTLSGKAVAANPPANATSAAYEPNCTAAALPTSSAKEPNVTEGRSSTAAARSSQSAATAGVADEPISAAAAHRTISATTTDVAKDLNTAAATTTSVLPAIATGAQHELCSAGAASFILSTAATATESTPTASAASAGRSSTPSASRSSPQVSLPPSPQGSPQPSTPTVKFSGAAAVPNLLDVEASPRKSRKRKGTHAGKENSEGHASKRSKTAAPAPPGKRKADGESSTANKRQRTGSEGAFSVAVPSGCQPWVQKVLQMLTVRDLGPKWRLLVEAWLTFEQGYSFEEKRKPYLSPSDRPAAVGEWIKWGRKPTHIPEVANLDEFKSAFNAWWRNLQPDWRVEGSRDLQKGDGSWECLQCSGVNGVVSAVAGLFIWGYALDDVSSAAAWDAAVVDMLYALQELAKSR